MSLIKCPECGKENVSDSAKACPACGYGIKAHFDRIDERKQRALQLEEEEKQRQKDIEMLMNRVRMPRMPDKIWVIVGIGVFLLMIALYEHSSSQSGVYGLFILGAVACFIAIIDDVRKYYRKYMYAKNNFEEYSRNVAERKLENDKIEAYSRQISAIHCPNCNSTRTKRISTTSRFTSIIMLGIASSKMGKQWQCNNCGYKW